MTVGHEAIVMAYGDTQPRLGENVYCAPTAAVIGDVELGDDCSVWFGAVIRGDVNYIRIGSKSNVQDNAVLHVSHGDGPLLIGSGVVIAHGAIVHACTLEDDVLIGIGAVVMDGAIIGAGSLVAAGSLVTPRTKVPPGSLVMGRPGRVVRPVCDDERSHRAAICQRYLEVAARYRQGSS